MSLCYLQNDLDELLKCEICDTKFTSSDQPLTISCGKTICKTCDLDIENKFTDKEKQIFKCPSCNAEHKKPNDGFPTNDIALRLLSLQPKQMPQSEESKQLFSNLQKIDDLLKKIELIIEEKNSKRVQQLNEIKKQIQLEAQEKIEQLNAQLNALITKINEHETESETLPFNKDLIKKVRTFFNDQKIKIKNLDIDSEISIIEANKNVVDSILKLQVEYQKAEQIDLNDKLFDFKENKTRLDENMLGVFRLKKKKELTYKEINKIIGHDNTVTSLCQLKNTKLMASSSGDTTIKIWDLSNNSLVNTLTGHTNSVNHLVNLPNGDLVSSSWDKTIKIWKENTFTLVRTLTGHSSDIHGLAVLPRILDFDYLISASFDHSIRIWNPYNGKLIGALLEHTEGVCGLTVMNDGRLASCSGDCTIMIWDMVDFSQLRVLRGHKSVVCAVTVLKSGDLSSCSADNQIRIWDKLNGDCIRVLHLHTDEVFGLAVLQNGLLASCSNDKTINIWNTDTGELVRSITGHSQGVCGLVVLDNGNLASCSIDKSIRIWDTTDYCYLTNN